MQKSFETVPIEVFVSVGKAMPMIKDLVDFSNNSLLQLDRRIDDPVDLLVGGKIVARGVLEEGENGELCVRITEVPNQVSSGS